MLPFEQVFVEASHFMCSFFFTSRLGGWCFVGGKHRRGISEVRGPKAIVIARSSSTIPPVSQGCILAAKGNAEAIEMADVTLTKEKAPLGRGWSFAKDVPPGGGCTIICIH